MLYEWTAAPSFPQLPGRHRPWLFSGLRWPRIRLTNIICSEHYPPYHSELVLSGVGMADLPAPHYRQWHMVGLRMAIRYRLTSWVSRMYPTGRPDQILRTGACALVLGFIQHGVSPHDAGWLSLCGAGSGWELEDGEELHLGQKREPRACEESASGRMWPRPWLHACRGNSNTQT